MGAQQTEAEQLILDLLGRYLRVDPAELRVELEGRGEGLPIDSLIMVEILLEVEEHFGVRVPETAEAAFALRSVRRLAALILRLVEQSRVESGE